MSDRSTTPPDRALVAELAPLGRLRVAINYGNPVLAQRDGGTGQPRGVSVDLANALAARARLDVELVTFDAAAKVFEALRGGAWDVAFLAIDPERAQAMSFTAPYLLIEGTYLVRAKSALRALDDFDRPGVRIAVGRGAAYDLVLTRTLKHAKLVRADTSAAAIELFVTGKLDAAAGVRQPLVAYAAVHPGFRVVDESFTSIRQAMALPRGRERALAYLGSFIEEMTACGFVADALLRSGQAGAAVARTDREPHA
ncbi:MAG TPA: transporter substrate-binding domain-containing protein [Casimicrobiaceae bacterium]|jgi:polar amino acid transport system substrate-binding protein